MKKYVIPQIELVSINTLDIMSISIQGDGADPYRSAGAWRGIIDDLNSDGMS